MTVLVLGDESDEHARHVRDRLAERDVEAFLLDSRLFPDSLRIVFEPVHGRGGLVLPGPPEREIPFEEIESVYWRSYGGVASSPLPDAEQAHVAENDARSLFESLLRTLPVRWVNGWDAFQLHQVKPAALARVAALGIEVPATMLANDPDAVVAFAAEHERCVFKPVQGGAHTERLVARHLAPENLANLRYAPVTIQEEIEGADVRVFVAGERVLACEIRTDAVDFRDDPSADIVAVDLPDEIAARSRRIARELHLLWTGMDYRRTADGRHVFLEANPSPMFLGFEERSGLPLTEALLDLLVTNDEASRR